MQTLQDFIAKHEITSETTYGVAGEDYPPGMDHMNPWTVTLFFCADSMDVPFFTGPAITDDPEAADVLSCMASDCAGVESAADFEEWADDLGYFCQPRDPYGYNPNPHESMGDQVRNARKTYELCRTQCNQLLNFLGSDLYTELLYETEGL